MALGTDTVIAERSVGEALFFIGICAFPMRLPSALWLFNSLLLCIPY